MGSISKPTILTLNGRGLKLDTRDDINQHLKDVDPTIIEEIHLNGNTIGVEASKALAEFLSKTRVLKVANFEDIFTGRLISEIPDALSAICDALVDKTSLVEIDLSNNAFGGRCVDPMVPFLTNNRSFQILRLNNNGLGPAGGIVIANALRESAKLSKAEGKKSNLRVVICGRNRLENGSAAAWAEAFAEHGTLQEVRMVQNGFRMEGITHLARGLAKNPGIQHIDLQDNTFTVDGELSGVEAWTESLASWPELHTLNLSDCVLSSDGEVPSLIESLAKGSNPKLHTLQLQNNNLETASFEVLAGAISEGLRSLMALELQWNDVEEDDEHLENLSLSLKQRGGKLFASDEEDEEEEEKKEQEEEEAEEEAREKEEEGKKAIAPEVSPTPSADAADDLANLLSKVEIR
ncbi:hypothetical protein M413DRAFT_443832 [Hebeloma cylindrosporum]|uniref:Ran-GTPase activating protein 1 C-terminal domain-containing protein n=1 Tax=Hebeloma cylindrosporum TaxID=76867 RepID=A0A0C3C241_HEBCY|nr:hypothetical protein M413DRAFT_443832 [Hebeloma cylindrosporum h7]